jgi:hypothetical protein
MVIDLIDQTGSAGETLESTYMLSNFPPFLILDKAEPCLS